MFALKPSFQFASFNKDVADLYKEYTLRKQAGFPVQWLDEKNVLKKFWFVKPAGLLSQDGDEVDAYKLTHCLLKKWISKGLQVYDNTEIITIRHHKHEIELIASNKKKIRAKKLIPACGYESQQYQKNYRNYKLLMLLPANLLPKKISGT